MELQLSEIQRTANRLIKYKCNIAQTKHFFSYELNGFYFSFIMFRGILVDANDREIKSQLIKGTKINGKHFSEYYNSYLNEWFKQGTETRINQHKYSHSQSISKF